MAGLLRSRHPTQAKSPRRREPGPHAARFATGPRPGALGCQAIPATLGPAQASAPRPQRRPRSGPSQGGDLPKGPHFLGPPAGQHPMPDRPRFPTQTPSQPRVPGRAAPEASGCGCGAETRGLHTGPALQRRRPPSAPVPRRPSPRTRPPASPPAPYAPLPALCAPPRPHRTRDCPPTLAACILGGLRGEWPGPPLLAPGSPSAVCTAPTRQGLSLTHGLRGWPGGRDHPRERRV